METPSYNMNDEATVHLTLEGAAAINAHFIDVYNEMPERCRGDRPAFLAGQEYRTEFWHLMRIFGAHLHNGGPNLFVNNRVAIRRRIA